MSTGSFSPVAGIQWVETGHPLELGLLHQSVSSFSPVAGIQWVETCGIIALALVSGSVSVPLPGFSGLRPRVYLLSRDYGVCFSPVAGIQWVETDSLPSSSSTV